MSRCTDTKVSKDGFGDAEPTFKFCQQCMHFYAIGMLQGQMGGRIDHSCPCSFACASECTGGTLVDGDCLSNAVDNAIWQIEQTNPRASLNIHDCIRRSYHQNTVWSQFCFYAKASSPALQQSKQCGEWQKWSRKMALDVNSMMQEAGVVAASALQPAQMLTHGQM